MTSKFKSGIQLASGFSLLIYGLMYGCNKVAGPAEVTSEPVAFGRFPGYNFSPPTSEAQLAATSDDYFHDMDGSIALTADEIQGRNTWTLWTADNAKFWDWMAGHSYGVLDLLKVLDSRKRDTRFRDAGLVNEPGYKKADRPDEFGLWLDVPVAASKPTPEFVKTYGDSTGVVGLRLFPNPKFDRLAQKRWGDGSRYFTDPAFFNDPKLVRPYMVGMSCGFCHVSPDPIRPPSDPEHPEWRNLSSYIGNQYFKVSKIFGAGLKDDSFVFHLLNSNPRGTLDTSFIATDHLNNPRTMNAIYNVGARLAVARNEKLSGGALNIPGTSAEMPVPHILKDGADSVGILGALSRVFVNIGEDSDDWIKDLNDDPLVGRKPFSPFDVAKAKNSVYWRATSNRVGNLASFFIKAAVPHHLEDAPGGRAFLTSDPAVLTRGKTVFAENCASCHSSKLPPGIEDLTSPQALAWFRKEALKPDFLQNNYLSNDRRYPVTLIGTNASSPSATNAMAGHIWDNFSSQTYKSLPSVGKIDCIDPVSLKHFPFQMPGGGPGYIRVPTLVALWASAPFFQNNSLGSAPMLDRPDPSVAGRMKLFDDSVTKLLWPERRLGLKSIWRTSTLSYLKIPKADLPGELSPFVSGDYLEIGPIPNGTPVNLLANLDTNLADPDKRRKMIHLAISIKKRLVLYKANQISRALFHNGPLTDEEIAVIFKPLVPELLALNKCPDFIEDKGHYFGARLSDGDKKALIEYLKWM